MAARMKDLMRAIQVPLNAQTDTPSDRAPVPQIHWSRRNGTQKLAAMHSFASSFLAIGSKWHQPARLVLTQ